MEDIELLKEDIRELFEKAGFKVNLPAGFEKIDRLRAYIHPSLGSRMSGRPTELSTALLELEGLLNNADNPMGIMIVCHSAGSFSFRVSVY